eukprot:5411-Heterococcus_DN1.PRE.1
MEYIDPLKRRMREQVLLAMVQPYQRVTVAFLAKELNLTAIDVVSSLVLALTQTQGHYCITGAAASMLLSPFSVSECFKCVTTIYQHCAVAGYSALQQPVNVLVLILTVCGVLATLVHTTLLLILQELLLIEMILDDRIKGKINQIDGYLELGDAKQTTRYA